VPFIANVFSILAVKLFYFFVLIGLILLSPPPVLAGCQLRFQNIYFLICRNLYPKWDCQKSVEMTKPENKNVEVVMQEMHWVWSLCLLK